MINKSLVELDRIHKQGNPEWIVMDTVVDPNRRTRFDVARERQAKHAQRYVSSRNVSQSRNHKGPKLITRKSHPNMDWREAAAINKSRIDAYNRDKPANRRTPYPWQVHNAGLAGEQGGSNRSQYKQRPAKPNNKNINNGGYVRDQHGNKIGRVDPSGDARDGHGNKIGRVDGAGNVKDQYGNKIGKTR